MICMSTERRCSTTVSFSTWRALQYQSRLSWADPGAHSLKRALSFDEPRLHPSAILPPSDPGAEYRSRTTHHESPMMIADLIAFRDSIACSASVAWSRLNL